MYKTPVTSDRGPAPAGPYTPAIRHGELLFAQMNAVYQEYFPEPRPARTTVQAGLAQDYRIEIDAIAGR